MNENLILEYMRHALDGRWWDESKARAQMDKITVPFYSSGNWGGWNHHLRGNLEAFTRAASKTKKLQVHIGGHTDYFYDAEGRNEQLRWYDYWLKGIDTGIMKEPPVKLCIRTSGAIARGASRTSGRSRARNTRASISAGARRRGARCDPRRQDDDRVAAGSERAHL